jgi:hypothetical protein
MIQKIKLHILIALLAIGGKALAQMPTTSIKQVDIIENNNHPQIAYWFFNKDMLVETAWKNKIDSLTAESKYTLIFLTARNNVDFFEPEKMQPIFSKLVAYAHAKGLKIALQLWGTSKNTSEAASERSVVESETILDENGVANIYNKAKHIRAQSGKPFKSALLKAFIFKQTTSGFYEPKSLVDITSQCSVSTITDSSVALKVNLGKQYAGYSVYIMTQHFYKVSSNYSQEAIDKFVNVLQAYKDIPFDGIGLDEYTNLKLFATWELQKAKEPLRERLYSLDMAKAYKTLYGSNIETALFNMRFAPNNQPEVRIKAINTYMDIMRKGTLNVETAMYDNAKKIFGPNTFVGLHDSHHNHLDGDEVWQTGINWWNVKRDYGHTDEGTPTATQMGIAFGYNKNMLYNMFYDKSIDKIQEKAFNDLRYNIRTHYHAINDVQNWGVSVEQPYALQKINPVENCARLLNQFNPALPDIKLLVVFGREALTNWYPDSSKRGICDINDKLKIEEKAMQIWNAGYLNALVPTDVIIDNRLVVDENGKAVYNGHVFDAVVFLHPEYAQDKTLSFLEKYVNKGGKLMIEGIVTKDFYGNNMTERWEKIAAKSISKKLDITQLAKLGIEKNNFANAIAMQDGSWIFSDYQSFLQNKLASFKQVIDGNTYEGSYSGYAAILVKNKQIQKLVATSLQSLQINGEIVLELNRPTDIIIESKNGVYAITIVGTNTDIKINKLK